MPGLRDDPVQLIAQEQVRLFSELKKLPEPAWRQPSACEGWSNARAVAHLIGGAEFYHRSVNRALRGDSLPPSIPGGQRLTPESFRQRQATHEETLGEKSRTELLATYDQACGDLVDLYRRVAMQHMTRPAWHPSGQWTVAMFVSRRVAELAFHGWDIHVSLDPTAVIRPEIQPFLIHLQWQLERRLFAGSDDLDGIYRFEVGQQPWCTRIFNGKLEHGPLEPAPDATIKMSGNSFLLLTTQRVSQIQLKDHGLLTIEGDEERTRELLKALSSP